jgi:uncharacterized small protein (DUF1192 family)
LTRHATSQTKVRNGRISPMSLFDDDRPQKKVAHEIGSDLALLSVDELTQRITLLTEEIARLEAERTRKSASRSAAENLFR